MSRRRMSIRFLMLAVVPIALALTALRSMDGAYSTFRLYHNVLYSCVAATLILAAIAARYRGAYWYGFAVAGWAYFLLATLGDHEKLVTSQILERTSELAYWGTMRGLSHPKHPKIEQAVQIGHLILTLLMAHAGGVIALILQRRQNSEADTVASDS